MTEPFKLLIISFDTILVNEPARYCSIATRAGRTGFEPRHEPFVSVLKEGSEIRYTAETGREGSLRVRNGLFTFRDNICTATVFI